MFKIGVVSKYLSKTGLSVIELIGDLSVDDNIRVMDRFKDTKQPKIEYIQVGSKKITYAKKGMIVAVKFDEEIKEGSEIFRS